MGYKLEGSVAVVTGAGRGIGKAIALGLAKKKVKVVIADLLLAEAETAVKEIEGMGGEAFAVQVDVSQEENVKAMADKVLARFGQVDIVVNNAGICPVTPLEEIPPEEWDRVLAVNLKGPYLVIKALLPAMKKQGWGRIVNIASVAGKMGAMVAGLHYTASKAGIIAMGKVLARHCGPYGITVNTVAPGPTATEMTADWTEEEMARLTQNIPLGRYGTMEEIAAGVLYLVSEEAGFVTGECLDVNGGLWMD